VKRAPAKRRVPPKEMPKLWRVSRAGKQIGAYHVTVGGVRVNLGTQDATLALERRKAAVKGRRGFLSDVDGAADDLVAALHVAAHEQGGAAPSGAHTPAAVGSTPTPATGGGGGGAIGGASDADHVAASPAPAAAADNHAAGDWHANLDAAVAAANVPSDAPPPAAPPEVSDEELAGLGVELQIWIAAARARQKVYRGFQTPTITDEGRAPLVEQWKKIVSFAGVGAILPPWVTGLLIPAVTLVTATVAMAAGFAALAEEQRKAAGAPVQATETPTAAPEAARATA
jgi:hypothetical protein